MAKHKKPAPAAKKKAAPKNAKPAPKKVAPAKVAPAKKPALKAAPKPAAPAAEPKPKSPVSKNDKPNPKANARQLLRSRILGAKKPSKPIALSLDEVREIAKTAVSRTAPPMEAKPAKASNGKKTVDLSSKLTTKGTTSPHHIKAASLADILGFNPKKAQKPVHTVDEDQIPEKFRRYYKLLLELRNHLTEGLNLHTEETLKRSSKDDSGDLSSYGQHMADAGTDTFDRDFALSLVSSEQEALTEIEAAIKRIHDGTYGVCEMTSKPIAKERLLAVPFTRFSAEAQKEIEKNRMRTRSSAGLFGELGEDGAKIEEDSGDE